MRCTVDEMYSLPLNFDDFETNFQIAGIVPRQANYIFHGLYEFWRYIDLRDVWNNDREITVSVTVKSKGCDFPVGDHDLSTCITVIMQEQKKTCIMQKWCPNYNSSKTQKWRHAVGQLPLSYLHFVLLLLLVRLQLKRKIPVPWQGFMKLSRCKSFIKWHPIMPVDHTRKGV